MGLHTGWLDDWLGLHSFGLDLFQVTMLTTSVKVSPELGEITFSTGKPKLTPGEAPTFQEF